MYSVVIIDDEPMICRGLSEKVSWSEWDCEVLGTAMNGLEGRELIDRVQPQIVITDIKMPGITGLELANYMKSRYPDTITIFLTGYNEFEFARTAIRENVFDYLTKPIDLNELQATIVKATAHLRAKQKNMDELHTMKAQLSEYFALAETGVILDLMLNRPLESDAVKDKIRALNLNIKMGKVILLELESSESSFIRETDLHGLVTQAFEANKCDVFPIVVEGRLAVIAIYNMDIQRSTMESRIAEAIRDVALKVGSSGNISVNAGFGKSFQSLEQLNVSYNSAASDLKARMFWELDHFSELPDSPSSPYTLPQQDMLQLYEMVEQGSEEAALQLLERIFGDIKKSRNMDLALGTGLELMFNLAKIAKAYEEEQMDRPVKKMLENDNFAEIVRYLQHHIKMICQLIHENKRVGKENILHQLTDYLQKNFHHPDITLRQVADHFHLSESHFSRLFKKQVGINFNDYLTQLRLEKAKVLLQEQYWLSNEEIANQVGFNDGKYMGQVFKKNCGMTLWEYKGRRSKKSEMLK